MSLKRSSRLVLCVAAVTLGIGAWIGSPVESTAEASSSGPVNVHITQFLDRSLISTGSVVRHSYGSGDGSLASDGYIKPGAPFVYTEFGGSQETVVPWVGTNVAVLVPKSESASLKPETMTEIINALDSSWTEYQTITGQSPTPDYTYDGRDSIAVVKTDSFCSGDAACSWLGMTGTEIFKPYFRTLYNGVSNNNQYDQALFYEFGRNFWFYGSSLAGVENPGTTYGSQTVTTGFAVFMRFRSMDATGTPGGPFNGTAFPTFEAQDWALVYDYDSDLSDTFANTLAIEPHWL
jgi:serralysin